MIKKIKIKIDLEIYKKHIEQYIIKKMLVGQLLTFN